MTLPPLPGRRPPLFCCHTDGAGRQTDGADRQTVGAGRQTDGADRQTVGAGRQTVGAGRQTVGAGRPLPLLPQPQCPHCGIAGAPQTFYFWKKEGNRNADFSL